jgi:carbamoylphosphate synthase small subunit
MGGGRMYQHVGKHGGNHSITDVETGLELLVSSTHHQMMMPSSDALLVATAALHGPREWFDGQKAMKDVSDVDIEVVYYHHIKALCFQPHPEFIGYPQMRNYFKRLLKEFCND